MKKGSVVLVRVKLDSESRKSYWNNEVMRDLALSLLNHDLSVSGTCKGCDGIYLLQVYIRSNNRKICDIGSVIALMYSNFPRDFPAGATHAVTLSFPLDFELEALRSYLYNNHNIYLSSLIREENFTHLKLLATEPCRSNMSRT